MPALLLLHVDRAHPLLDRTRRIELKMSLGHELKLPELRRGTELQETTFNLLAFIAHHGSSRQGHYIACLSTPEGWRQADDGAPLGALMQTLPPAASEDAVLFVLTRKRNAQKMTDDTPVCVETTEDTQDGSLARLLNLLSQVNAQGG